MKKIVILHASNTFNYGSFMMLINFISWTSKLTKEKIVFFVDLDSKRDLERLQLEVPEISIQKINLKKGDKNKSFLNRIEIKLRELFQHNEKIFRSADAVVVLGGDDLSEYYGKNWILLDFYKLHKLSNKFSVYLVGQTIGPFSSYRKLLARRVLQKCKVYTRDSLCSEYLKENLKIKSSFESSDLAFLDLPLQWKKTNLLTEYKLKKEDYITLVPSGLTNQYTENKKDYIEGWLEIIRGLLKNKKLKNKKIVLLPHVLKPERVDDRKVINEIVIRLNKNEKDKVVIIGKELLPSEARFILGNGLFTLTGRMHAAISTFQMGKPAISLSYSVKYGGIIGTDLKRDDLIIESKNEELWKSKKILNEINNRIQYVLKNYNNLTVDIHNRVKYLMRKSLSQVEDISSKLI